MRLLKNLDIGEDLVVNENITTKGNLTVQGNIVCEGDSIKFADNAIGNILLNDGVSFNSTPITGRVSINGQGITNLDVTDLIENKDIRANANIEFSKISMDVDKEQLTINVVN